MLEVTLIQNKSNEWGILRDSRLLHKALSGKGQAIRVSDPLEPPVATDIAIHLEVPNYGFMPWARYNILVVNPEWYPPSAWDSYLSKFDKVVFKDAAVRGRFLAETGLSEEKCVVVPWASIPFDTKESHPRGEHSAGFVWFLGASVNKIAMVKQLLPQWRESYPPLHVFSSELVDLSGVSIPSNVTMKAQKIDPIAKIQLEHFFPGHICVSQSEGFGFTAAEAEQVGAFRILNDLEVYRESYEGSEGVAWLPCTLETRPPNTRAKQATLDTEKVQAGLDSAIEAFLGTDFDGLRAAGRAASKNRIEASLAAWDALFANATLAKKIQPLPPVLMPEDCPPISIVTLLYNRRKFFDLACHSILVTDYPKEKIEWIVIEDSDDPKEDASDRVVQVQQNAAPITMQYIPLKKKTPIGEKRNLAIEKASHEIIVMMDDDDHYPATSLRRRVAWLTKHPWKPKAAAVTAIACYDLLKGVSAINIPPMDIPLSQRVSEATLTFYKSWWQERGFPSDVQIGEAESFLAGREEDVIEIPPQQVIVAFSHNKNVSSRRIPSGADIKPGCFWRFPKEFLVFIHGLAGVSLVDENGKSLDIQGARKPSS